MDCISPDALILKTKFYIPRPRSKLVSRPHLLEKLAQGLSTPLTLVSAQAGFGKTTLLSEWLGQSHLRAAWISLDESDNDPGRFASSMHSAFQTLDAELGKRTLVRSSGPMCDSPSLAEVLTRLINELLLLPESQPIVLVLDDYHVLTEPAIHEAVAFFLDHLPAQVHLVIATRVDPPLPLARLRVRNQLTEIRVQDLRFTSEQAAEFLERVMGLPLSRQDVDALEKRTEGWVAGLQLAALAMQASLSAGEPQDTANFLTSFTGSHRLVLDYLVEEILDRQPKEVRSFLLQTSILERMTASLCNAVTARQDAPAMLQVLERGNLFLTPLDAGRCCYHYHPLFAQALRYRLEQTDPAELVALHRRAAEWYAQNGMLVEAAAHRLAAGDSQPAPSPVGPARQSNDLPEPLNGRELEILQRVAQGQSNREIAEGLALTTGTVKWYMTQILAKLRAGNRTEAVARARDLKLLP